MASADATTGVGGGRGTVDGALALVREILGMDTAYLTELTGGRQIFHAADGDAESFGIAAGDTIPEEGGYCVRVWDGSLPNLIPDTAADPRVRDLPVTHDARIGSYVSIPLRFPDGTQGTLCAMSHAKDPALAARDMDFLHVVARLVEDSLVREAAEREARLVLDEEIVEHAVQLRTAMARLNVASMESILMLSTAVEYRDDDTGRHTARVGRQAARLARAAGMDSSFCEQLLAAAPLHDAGKVAIPDAVLLKPGRLTPEERAVMETHAEIGHALLRTATSDVLKLAASVAHTHHERFDGSGYPRGLAGADIPVEGRITAIVDVHDALSHDRVYRPAFPPERVTEMLVEGRGSHFDPELLDLFIASSPDPAAA